MHLDVQFVTPLTDGMTLQSTFALIRCKGNIQIIFSSKFCWLPQMARLEALLNKSCFFPSKFFNILMSGVDLYLSIFIWMKINMTVMWSLSSSTNLLKESETFECSTVGYSEKYKIQKVYKIFLVYYRLWCIIIGHVRHQDLHAVHISLTLIAYKNISKE